MDNKKKGLFFRKTREPLLQGKNPLTNQDRRNKT